jgi:WD40 repeat protein
MKTRLLMLSLIGLLLTPLLSGIEAAPASSPGKPEEIVSFQAYRFYVEALAISPDGKVVATGGQGEALPTGGRLGRVKLWNAANGKNLLDIAAHNTEGKRWGDGHMNAIAFSPDGKTLASCGADQKLKLWDVAKGKNIDTFAGSLGPPLLFSPDGKSLICGHRQFNLATKKERPLVENLRGIHRIAAFNSKGDLLLGASLSYPDPTSFEIWDVKTGKKILTCKSDRKVFGCKAFGPDGKTVVSIEGEYEGMRKWAIRLWEVSSGKCTANYECPGIPNLPSFSPDGKVLAVVSQPVERRTESSSIRLLEIPSGKILATLKGHKRYTGFLAFSSNGRLLASGGGDGIVKIWRLPARYK